MTTKSKTDSQIVRNAFFANQPKPEGIVIPTTPVILQANCAQKGSWVIGEEQLGNKPIKAFIVGLHHSPEWDAYKDKPVNWAIIHFVPVDSEMLKTNLVYTTKIKNMASNRKGSLFNLGNRIAELIALGLDPREVIWTFSFVGKSGALPNGDPYSCSVLDFNYEPISSQEEATILDRCVAAIQQEQQIHELTLAAMAGDEQSLQLQAAKNQPAISASAVADAQANGLVTA